MNFKKYIGTKSFYKMVITVAVPIMIQNFITNFVNMLDNIMVGSLGTEQVSGVAIVNQIVFIFNLAIFGAISGAGIFTSQFFGKGDDDGIRYTFRFKTIVCLVIGVAAVAVFLGLGGNVIKLFLHEGSKDCDIELAYKYAVGYMRICTIGLIPYAVTQMYSSTMRETGETFVPMLIGFSAVIINTVFNLLLIFGLCGMPKIGVNGAAAATVLARICECLLTVWYAVRHTDRHKYFKGAFSSLYIPGELFKSIFVKGVPLLINETLWSVGMSLISMSYSFHGLAVVAGYSISSTVINLFNIVFMAFGTSIGIIVGRYLGANDFERAVDYNRKLMAFSVLISAVIGAVVFTVGRYIPGIYNTSPESKEYAAYFIKTTALFMPVSCFAHSAYFALRSGGKTLITFLVDSMFICVITVPVSFVLYFAFGLPIKLIFPIVQSMDIIKCIIGYILIKKRVWVQNIVE